MHDQIKSNKTALRQMLLLLEMYVVRRSKIAPHRKQSQQKSHIKASHTTSAASWKAIILHFIKASMISSFVCSREMKQTSHTSRDAVNHHILRPNFTPGLVSNFTGQYSLEHQFKRILRGLKPHELLAPNFGWLKIGLGRSLHTLHSAM